MLKRLIYLFMLSHLSTIGFAACNPPYFDEVSNPKTVGMVFIDNGKYSTIDLAKAMAAAHIPPINLTEQDLCYGYESKWGTDKYIEKGTRSGWCQIELFGDLTYKGYKTVGPPNTMRNEKIRDINDKTVGVNWPLMDCTVVPPLCDIGFTAFRISNLMHNSTGSGLINGNQTTIVQSWTCIKI